MSFTCFPVLSLVHVRGMIEHLCGAELPAVHHTVSSWLLLSLERNTENCSFILGCFHMKKEF